jgi:malonate transporter MadM subunit
LITDTLTEVLTTNGLIFAFALVGILVWASYWLSGKLTRGRIHGSAIAITIGLALAWIGGSVTGGTRGLADFSLLAGIGVMGGGMFRDFAIVATAFGASLNALKRAGVVGAASILIGVVLSFVTGAIVAVAFGYRDAVSISMSRRRVRDSSSSNSRTRRWLCFRNAGGGRMRPATRPSRISSSRACAGAIGP